MNTKQSGIYSITSKINGKRYIGSSIRIGDRWKEHKALLKRNKHHSAYLQNHYNKYGEDDFIFSVVEIVDKQNLTLKDFKQLLLDKEQIYLNNWAECQFNSNKLAHSCLGSKNKDARYYDYNKKQNCYTTWYSVNGHRQYFSSHTLEKDAITQVEYIKTLNEQEVIDYHKQCKLARRKDFKNYNYNKSKKFYKTYYIVNGKRQHFNCHFLEEDAISQIEYIKTLSQQDLMNYYNQCKDQPYSKRPNL